MTPPQKLESIGRYQVLERVGKGGMGVLYRGFDPVLDREVAIKLMHADFSEDTEQMRPRFYREARAAAKLNHRNIVTIFEFAEEHNVPYIVMEFLRGTPLGARMSLQPPLTLDDKLNVVAQLCDGLAYAHEQGVVHRDVKPDNVFLLEDGSVKLLDFGIAKLTTSTLTRQGDVLGSASYMSPEQVGGSESVDGRADVFSAGVVLYEMLAGKKPFEGDSPTSVLLKILRENPTPLETLITGLPPGLIAVVMRALQKDPADRYPTADAMGRELSGLRKSIHPSMSTAQMDETRFASTQVIKALHEDFQRSRAGGTVVGTDTLAPTMLGQTLPAAAAATIAPAAEKPAASKSSRLIPAVIGAAIAVAVVFVGLRLRGGSTSSSGDAVVPSTETTQAALQQTAPVDTQSPALTTEPPAPPPGDPAAVAPVAGDPAAGVVASPAAPVAAAAGAAVPPPPPPAPPAVNPPAADRPAATDASSAAATAARVAQDRAGARPADAANGPKTAPEEPADAAAASAAAPTGTLFVDFINTFPDGSAEVEVDGRRRWSEKLGLSQQVAGLAKLKLQRVSEQLGGQLKVPVGDHRITVTILNADGEVRDIQTTSLHVAAAGAVTLRIRISRFRNQLQIDSVAGEPPAK